MLQLVKQTQNTVIATQVEPALTFITRFKGLIGRAQIKPGYTLWLRPCSAVHTFFMRFPIDVIFVSKDWRVVGKKDNISPWRVTEVYPDAVHVFEFTSGTIKATGIKVGDELLIRGN